MYPPFGTRFNIVNILHPQVSLNVWVMRQTAWRLTFRLDGPRFDFSHLYNVPTGSGTHPVSSSTAPVFLPRGKTADA